MARQHGLVRVTACYRIPGERHRSGNRAGDELSRNPEKEEAIMVEIKDSYFKGPDGMIFEYSVGVDEIEDEATHRPRQFGFEPTSFCMWGSKPAGMALPNN